MSFIVDFHIHSHFSRATSKLCTPEHLEYWAKIKGIHVLGTGDCIHPGWLKELKDKLEPARNGLFRLKPEWRLKQYSDLVGGQLFNSNVSPLFMLTTEISSIYKKNDCVRKVHNICVFPDFESVDKLQAKLDKIGNIKSDGRPILGLDSKILLEMVLETSELAYLIPAHIWTPWFSVLGSKSGFDTIDDCFEELTPYIFALETGLSSDPPMNRACSFLDKFRLVSNSDAHSPEKLGREANIFNTELSYKGILNALKEDEGFLGTIEFFPQEGKYHYDGHRKCGVCLNPYETITHKGLCPTCGKPVTKGVMYRVAELADRPLSGLESTTLHGVLASTDKTLSDLKSTHGSPFKQTFYSITPLPSLLAEIAGVKSVTSKKVKKDYYKCIKTIGSEFEILLGADLNLIREQHSETLAEGIKRLRNGNVFIQEGYDGEFGRVKVFKK
ncbi:endonuclease Q family protein [Thermoproteota archaeon]